MSNRIAGGCAVVVLGGGAVAITVAAAPAFGILFLWTVGFGSLWWSVSRPVADTPDHSPTATPPEVEATNTQFNVVPDPTHLTRQLVEWYTEKELES